MTKNEKILGELINFILSVDRRYIVIKEFQHSKMLQASHIAKKVGRSLQNCSRALKELEGRGIVTPISPGKKSWKRYTLTEKGKNLLSELKRQGWLRI